jgi:hypothetical protein
MGISEAYESPGELIAAAELGAAVDSAIKAIESERSQTH